MRDPPARLTNAVASKMLFNDKGEGWIIGIKGEAAYVYNRKNLALHTRDFGKTWLDVTPRLAVENKTNASSIVLFEDVFTDIYLENNSQVISLSRDGKILHTIDHGFTWTILPRASIYDDYSLGFAKLIKTNESEFVAMIHANGPEGVWSSFTSIDGDEIKEISVLEDIFISDINLRKSGEAIAGGLRNDFTKTSDGVILTTGDFVNWKVLYEESGNCKLGCKFNKMSQRGNNGYCFVGSDGIIVTMNR